MTDSVTVCTKPLMLPVGLTEDGKYIVAPYYIEMKQRCEKDKVIIETKLKKGISTND